jgi:uncharacterized Zn ribbon protein
MSPELGTGTGKVRNIRIVSGDHDIDCRRYKNF